MDSTHPEASVQQTLPRYWERPRLAHFIDGEYKPGRLQDFDVYTHRVSVSELIVFQALLRQINPCQIVDQVITAL